MSDFATSNELRTALSRYDSETVSGIVDTGRYRLRYISWGDSQAVPLVFIHGMSDQARSFAMVMSRLVDAGIRCIGYESPKGRGDGANLGMIKHTDYVADLQLLLDNLKLERVNLLGSSFGTTIALRTLATLPDRIGKAVLKGAFARRPLRRIERGLARLGRYWPWDMGDLPVRDRELWRMEGIAFERCDPDVFQFLLDCSGTTPIRAAARRTLIIDKLDVRALLPRIPHSVCLIGGDHDQIVPRWCEEEVARGLVRVQRVELSPCGHYPQYSMPGVTANCIIDFLKTKP